MNLVQFIELDMILRYLTNRRRHREDFVSWSKTQMSKYFNDSIAQISTLEGFQSATESYIAILVILILIKRLHLYNSTTFMNVAYHFKLNTVVFEQIISRQAVFLGHFKSGQLRGNHCGRHVIHTTEVCIEPTKRDFQSKYVIYIGWLLIVVGVFFFLQISACLYFRSNTNIMESLHWHFAKQSLEWWKHVILTLDKLNSLPSPPLEQMYDSSVVCRRAKRAK